MPINDKYKDVINEKKKLENEYNRLKHYNFKINNFQMQTEDNYQLNSSNEDKKVIYCPKIETKTMIKINLKNKITKDI